MASPFGKDALGLIAGLLSGFGGGLAKQRQESSELDVKALAIMGQDKNNEIVPVRPEDLEPPNFLSRLVGGGLRTRSGSPVLQVGNNYFTTRPARTIDDSYFDLSGLLGGGTGSPFRRDGISDTNLRLNLPEPTSAPQMPVQPQNIPVAPTQEAAVPQNLSAAVTKNVKENVAAFQRLSPAQRKQYDDIIDAELKKYPNVTKEEVYAFIAQESKYVTRAVSPAGAQGLMQLMPATSERHGVTDPYDPAQNIAAGIKELSELKKRFGGDQRHSYAGYNSDANKVLERTQNNQLPAETQKFVPAVMNTAARLKPLLSNGASAPPAPLGVAPLPSIPLEIKPKLPGHSIYPSLILPIDGKAYIVPTMYDGKGLTAEEVSDKIRANNFVHPETGQALVPYNSINEALKADKIPKAGDQSKTTQSQIAAKRTSAPEPTGKVLGVLPGALPGFPGRKIIENVDGSHSTHLGSTMTFGDKTYIVPTMYDGKVVTQSEAARIIRTNKFVDPDTGQILTPYNSVEEALQAQKVDHDRLEATTNKIVQGRNQPETNLSQMVAGPATPTPLPEMNQESVSPQLAAARLYSNIVDLTPDEHARIELTARRAFLGRRGPDASKELESFRLQLYKEARLERNEVNARYDELVKQHHIPKRQDVRSPADLARVRDALKGVDPAQTQAAHVKQAVQLLKSVKDNPEKLREAALTIEAVMTAHHYPQATLDRVFSLSGAKAILYLADKKAEEEGMRGPRLKTEVEKEEGMRGPRLVTEVQKIEGTADAEARKQKKIKEAEHEIAQRFGDRLPGDMLGGAQVISKQLGIPINEVLEKYPKAALNAANDQLEAQQKIRTNALPIPDVERQRLEVIFTAERNFATVNNKYTTGEIKQYTGLIRGRMESLSALMKDIWTGNKSDTEKAQFIQEQHTKAVSDIGKTIGNEQVRNKFFEFAADVKRIEELAFGTGGKALTIQEKSVIFGFLPTLEDYASGAFIAKLEGAVKHTDFAINLMKSSTGFTYGNVQEGMEKQQAATKSYGEALRKERDKSKTTPAKAAPTQEEKEENTFLEIQSKPAVFEGTFDKFNETFSPDITNEVATKLRQEPYNSQLNKVGFTVIPITANVGKQQGLYNLAISRADNEGSFQLRLVEPTQGAPTQGAPAQETPEQMEERIRAHMKMSPRSK